jgi:hypothetical protein
MNPEIGAGARFSQDNKYRFALWRIWDLDKPLAMLIGLNPSKATEKKDDRTVARLNGKGGLIYRNGFGGFYMMNLYPFITPYPKELKAQWQYGGQLGENNHWLRQVNNSCEAVVFCWGNFETYGRAKEIVAMFPRAMCFGRNSNGSPKHPLFLQGDTKMRDF